MLIDDKVIVKGADAWEVETGRLADIRVPPTLAGVLQARLDALQPAERETLQRAAVVGRTFWESAVETLGTVMLDQQRRSHETLTHLRGKELIFDHEIATFQNERNMSSAMRCSMMWPMKACCGGCGGSIMPRSPNGSRPAAVSAWPNTPG